MANGDLKRLARDLGKAADKGRREVPKVTKRGAVEVKRQWSLDLKARSLAHARALPYAVNFDDTDNGAGVASAEIGPDKSRNQGPLGNLLEFGSPEHGTEAGKEGERALNLQAPKYERYLGDIGDYGL